jgi:acetyl esterase/lipase
MNMDIINVDIGDRGAGLTAYIQRPSQEMASAAVKPAVLVLPGGGYSFCSDREAEPIALAYAAEGFQAFVLRYSVGEKAVGRQPLKEAGEAVGLIRRQAGEWSLFPDRIAVCGFSAGGHLGAWVSLMGSAKPDAAILCYPATRLAKPGVHSRIAACLLGDGYSDGDAESVNLAGHVTPEAPPMFAWITADDAIIDARSVLAYADAYAAAKRPFELHVFQSGQHGLSLAKPTTASGRLAMADASVAAWLPMSVEWLWRQFGRPETA